MTHTEVKVHRVNSHRLAHRKKDWCQKQYHHGTFHKTSLKYQKDNNGVSTREGLVVMPVINVVIFLRVSYQWVMPASQTMLSEETIIIIEPISAMLSL